MAHLSMIIHVPTKTHEVDEVCVNKSAQSKLRLHLRNQSDVGTDTSRAKSTLRPQFIQKGVSGGKLGAASCRNTFRTLGAALA